MRIFTLTLLYKCSPFLIQFYTVTVYMPDTTSPSSRGASRWALGRRTRTRATRPRARGGTLTLRYHHQAPGITTTDWDVMEKICHHHTFYNELRGAAPGAPHPADGGAPSTREEDDPDHRSRPSTCPPMYHGPSRLRCLSTPLGAPQVQSSQGYWIWIGLNPWVRQTQRGFTDTPHHRM